MEDDTVIELSDFSMYFSLDYNDMFGYNSIEHIFMKAKEDFFWLKII